MFQAGCIGLRTSRSSNCLMCGVMPFLTSGEWSTGGLWMNLTWPDLTLAWFYKTGVGVQGFSSPISCVLGQPNGYYLSNLCSLGSDQWPLVEVCTFQLSYWSPVLERVFHPHGKKNWLLHQRIYLDFHFSQEIRAQQMLWAFWNHRKWKSY